jgi:hypothetical protein
MRRSCQRDMSILLPVYELCVWQSMLVFPAPVIRAVAISALAESHGWRSSA